MVNRRLLLQVAAAGAWTSVMGCSRDGRTDAGAAARTVPSPAGMVRTSWSTDPWTLGSYSYLPVGGDPTMRTALATPIGERVWFAGEACSTEAPSTVHGALASGRAAANAVGDVAAATDRVIVIGAGIAGLAAAADLTPSVAEVIVVEARDRIGGRLDTVEPPGWAIPVERGASWIHDVDASDLAERIRDAAVAVQPFDYEAVTLDARSGRRVDTTDAETEVERRLASALEWAEAQDDDRSLADAFAAVGAGDGSDRWVDWYLDTEIVTEYGADAGDLSAWFGLEEGTEGDDLLVLGGYGRLAERLAADLDVRLSHPVTIVEHRDTGVTVTIDGGETLNADRVVVTVPLGVLSAGTITFEPPLPDPHRHALSGLGMGLLDKFWFRFDEPFWSERAPMWTRVGGDNPFREWFNLELATGEPVLLALVGGAAARELAELPDAEIERRAIESLQEFVDAGW